MEAAVASSYRDGQLGILKLLGKGSPKEQPDSSEALMMVVMEVATQKVHMKLGAIKRDSEGGPYVDEDEWMPDGDVSNLKTSFMPTFNA